MLIFFLHIPSNFLYRNDTDSHLHRYPLVGELSFQKWSWLWMQTLLSLGFHCRMCLRFYFYFKVDVEDSISEAKSPKSLRHLPLESRFYGFLLAGSSVETGEAGRENI